VEWLQAKDGKGCDVFVRLSDVSAVRDQSGACWVCCGGQWVMVQVDFPAVCRLLVGLPAESEANGAGVGGAAP